MYEKNLGSNHKNKEMGFWNGGGYPMMQFKTLNENTRYNQTITGRGEQKN